MDNHLGYANHERSEQDSSNSHNGFSTKKLKTSMGAVPIRIPRDRESSFNPQIVKKHQRDVSATIEDIYGFEMSHEQISHITDCVMEEVREWQTRALKPFYPFIFVDCLYVSLRTEQGIRQSAVHVILAYDTEGRKDVLGLWINETESKHVWMQIFDELKARGIEEIGFLSMDGVSG